MKRNVVCLVILLILTVVGTGSQLYYSRMLKAEIDDAIHVYKKTEDPDTCQALLESYREREFLNRIFLSKSYSEKLEITMIEIEEYAKAKNVEETKIALDSLEAYSNDLSFNIFG